MLPLIFIFLFDTLFLILLLLGEGFLGIYVLAGLALLFLGTSLLGRQLDWRKITQPLFKKTLILWVIFLLALIISSLFTHSVPLAINSLLFYGFAFITFWFFALVKDSFLSKDWLLKNLLVVTLVLCFLSILFLFFPAWASLLPGMNLFYSSYGHNHLAAPLLLTIPIAWYFWMSDTKFSLKKNGKTKLITTKDKSSQLKNIALLFLPLILTLSLLISFGRVAVFIGFFQLLVIGWIFLHKRYKSRIFKIILSLLTVAFVLILSSKLFFSTIYYFQPDFKCPTTRYQNQICKRIDQEARVFYWGQALQGLKNNLWTGYGPGTFSLINKKYRQLPYVSTGYAHNAFLKNLSEMGILGGGAFTLLMGFLLYKSLKTTQNTKINKNNNGFSLNSFLLLGIFSIYFDVLFDFDWSFSGVFALTLIFLALILKDKNGIQSKSKLTASSKKKELNKGTLQIRIFQLCYLLISIFVIGMASFYFYLEILIKNDQIAKAFQIFPYFQYHMKLFLLSPDLGTKQKNQLWEIHKYNPSFQGSYKIEFKDNKERVNDEKVWELWQEIDPWQRYYHPEKANLDELLTDLEMVKQKYDYEGDYFANQEMVEIIATQAAQLFEQGDLKKSAEYYVKIQQLDEWWVGNNEIPIYQFEAWDNFEKQGITLEQLEQFLKVLAAIDSEFYSYNKKEIANLHSIVIEQKIENRDLERLRYHVDRVLEIAEWVRWELLDQGIRGKLQTWVDELVVAENSEAEELSLLINKLYGDMAEVMPQLGHYYLLVGEKDKARQAYVQCQQIWDQVEWSVEEDCWECTYGMKILDEGWDYKIHPYHKMSQIIRGVADWDDFE